MNMISQLCPVCHSRLAPYLFDWCFKCSQCGFFQSSLTPQIDVEDTTDEIERASGLKNLRQLNFQKIIQKIRSLTSNTNQNLLDVGSAHGWFLAEARSAGFNTLGIEPSLKAHISEHEKKSMGEVRVGYFPSALKDAERFDIITFNDVFEHIPGVNDVLDNCSKHLNPDGLLVINLPNSRGLFYKIASLFAFFGIKGPFERLWQKGFASPHLSYFSPQQLRRLVESHGYKSESVIALRTLTYTGLWSRIHTDESSSKLMTVPLFAILLVMIPFLNLFPSDIHCEIFRKTSR